jgi:hypothetical protein
MQVVVDFVRFIRLNLVEDKVSLATGRGVVAF